MASSSASSISSLNLSLTLFKSSSLSNLEYIMEIDLFKLAPRADPDLPGVESANGVGSFFSIYWKDLGILMNLNSLIVSSISTLHF